MIDAEKEQVKRLVEDEVLPDDILFHKVLGYIAKKYSPRVVVDFVKRFDEVYPERREDKRRTMHVPTLQTITQKAHARLF